jgi:hypothetical protein
MGADLLLYTVVAEQAYHFEQLKEPVLQCLRATRAGVERLELMFTKDVKLTKADHILANTIGIDEAEDARDWLNFNTEEEVLKFVQKVCDEWPELGRDTSSREYKGRLIVSCGDSTWGDEPDGEGYTIMKRIDELGIWGAFNFE